MYIIYTVIAAYYSRVWGSLRLAPITMHEMLASKIMKLHQQADYHPNITLQFSLTPLKYHIKVFGPTSQLLHQRTALMKAHIPSTFEV